MLVLSRKCGESIRVADGIIFTILECTGAQVKVGITAPPQLPVHREEVYLRIREENLAAAQSKAAMDALVKNVPEELRRMGKEEATGEKLEDD
ncbi:MAG: carbon storage regulator CsrA [Candidatus Neomarinimicrobiota bacterium]